MSIMDILISEPPPLHMDTNGVLRVGGTRIPLETVITEYRNGADADEIAFNYDSLQLADVHAVIAYYLKHSSDVTAYLDQQEKRAEQVHVENERRSPSDGLRDRLLARRSKVE
ncbi:MAG: hypothetical protein JWN14_4712 [Chthonomonadales bacterium]|nr:hypothetical protein [Chthonomonadales bacterium]